MASASTIVVKLECKGVKAFRKECKRTTAALKELHEIRAEMLWECRQCRRANDFNSNTCKHCGAAR